MTEDKDELQEEGEALPKEQQAEALSGGENAENSGEIGQAGGAEGSEGAEEKIAALEAQAAEWKDQYLRKAADFENYRKRAVREKQEAIDFANQSLLLDLIQTLDNFDLALKSAGPSEAADGQNQTPPQNETGFTALRDGVSLIETQLLHQLESKWSLKRFDSKGEPFDPSRHEALMSEPSGEVSEPVVGEEFSKGYMLKERVIRPAKVKVLMPEGAK